MNGTHFSFVQISAGRHASPAGPRRVRRKPGQSHAIHERRDSATAYPWSKWWRLINRCSSLSTKPSSPSRRPTHAASPHAAVPAWALGTPPPPPPLPISLAATISSFPFRCARLRREQIPFYSSRAHPSHQHHARRLSLRPAPGIFSFPFLFFSFPFLPAHARF
jgi:hypothetical protein